MKRTVVLLLIFTALLYTAVYPSYARDPAPASVLELLNEIKAQITSGQQQLEGLPAKVDALTTKVDTLTTNVDTLTTKVDALTTKVDALSDKFDAGLAVTQKIYYLTKDPVSANEAKEACDNGFHMASLWEILDPTTLQYDQDTGRAYHRPYSDDQGSGPPSEEFGWVRTGKESTASDDQSGNANCANWSSTDHNDYGSVVALLNVWDYLHFSAPWWLSSSAFCDASSIRVWCVQD